MAEGVYAAEGQATISRLQIQWVLAFFAESTCFGKLLVVLFVIRRESHIFYPEIGLRVLCEYQEYNWHHLSLRDKTLAYRQHLETCYPSPVLWYLEALEGTQVATWDSGLALSFI
jgi:hypothetical protein